MVQFSRRAGEDGKATHSPSSASVPAVRRNSLTARRASDYRPRPIWQSAIYSSFEMQYSWLPNEFFLKINPAFPKNKAFHTFLGEGQVVTSQSTSTRCRLEFQICIYESPYDKLSHLGRFAFTRRAVLASICIRSCAENIGPTFYLISPSD